MKKLIFSLLIVIAVCTCPALSAGITWDGGDATDDWSAPDNWDPCGVPTGSDQVIINAPGSTITYGEINVDTFFYTLDLQAGTLDGIYGLYFGFYPSAEFTVSGGTLDAAWLEVGRDYDATLTQNGGTVKGGPTWGQGMILGENNFDGYGIYNMNRDCWN